MQSDESRPTLYASDLDGTLAGPDARISDRTRSDLEEILGAGIPFTIATARSAQTTLPIIEGVSFPLPIVTFNGAFLSNLSDGTHEHLHAFERAEIEPILRIGRRFGLTPFVSAYDGGTDNLYHESIANPGMQDYLDGRIAENDPRLRPATMLDAIRDEQVVCLTYVDSKERLKELLAALEGIDLAHSLFENLYYPGWHWLTLRHPLAKKGLMVRELMRRRGMEDFRLVVFGDEMNDLSLFAEADHAVAVGNAAPALKELADEIIGPNTEDSVTRYVLEHR